MEHFKHLAWTVLEHFLVNRKATMTGLIREGEAVVCTFSCIASHCVRSCIFVVQSFYYLSAEDSLFEKLAHENWDILAANVDD